jgi:hypothetical protein
MGLNQLARRFNCDAHGNPIVLPGRSEEKQVDPKPAKILERPAEPPAKYEVEELRKTVAEIPAKKMGRPSKGKPWVEAGVSKASWYRQQKSKEDV